MSKIKVAVVGSGNIGTDLMMKIMKRSSVLEMSVMVGVDPASDGLARAKKLGFATTDKGLEGLVAMPEFKDVQVVFDATSAQAHLPHAKVLALHGKLAIDLTPAAVGPFVVPVVNLEQYSRESNVNMVTCGGQATIPMVAAVSRVAKVHYGEIVASIASRSAGPGTRANIDEFTETTSRAIESVGGATRGKAIIILNPADPPLIMRDTVFTFSDEADHAAIEKSIAAMIAQVQKYVPGYRLKQRVQFDAVTREGQQGMKTSIFLEVEGAADYLPAYAGNLDIMTSAALTTAERLATIRRAS